MKTRTGKPKRSRQGTILAAYDRRPGSLRACPSRAYCEREGLEPWNFHWWRQVLARRDREVPSARTVRTPELDRPSRPAPSAFLPVRVVQDAAEPIAATTPIEIVLPAGPTVRVTRGFDPIALDAVLSVLEARRC